MFVGLLVDGLADAGKMGIHHERWSRRMLDITGTLLPVDGEMLVGHGGGARNASRTLHVVHEE